MESAPTGCGEWLPLRTDSPGTGEVARSARRGTLAPKATEGWLDDARGCVATPHPLRGSSPQGEPTPTRTQRPPCVKGAPAKRVGDCGLARTSACPRKATIPPPLQGTRLRVGPLCRCATSPHTVGSYPSRGAFRVAVVGADACIGPRAHKAPLQSRYSPDTVQIQPRCAYPR